MRHDCSSNASQEITKTTIIKDGERELQNNMDFTQKKRTLHAYDGDAEQDFGNSFTDHMNNETNQVKLKTLRFTLMVLLMKV